MYETQNKALQPVNSISNIAMTQNSASSVNPPQRRGRRIRRTVENPIMSSTSDSEGKEEELQSQNHQQQTRTVGWGEDDETDDNMKRKKRGLVSKLFGAGSSGAGDTGDDAIIPELDDSTLGIQLYFFSINGAIVLTHTTRN